MAYSISKDKCIACGNCMSVCPVDAIQSGKSYRIDADLCIECGACQSECQEGAIEPASN